MIHSNQQVALVTGSARRIGAAIVTTLHAAGFKVVIHCHNALEEAKDLASHLNHQRSGSVLVLQNDLIEPQAATTLMKSLTNWAGRLDLLVNNAALFARSDCTDLDQSNWDKLFHVNVKAPFLLSIAARSLLAENQGAIINITDIHAQKPLKGYAVYCQTKAALEMQTKSLAKEFAPEIRVNAVAPGPTIWPEQDNSVTQEQKAKIIDKTLLKRPSNPEYIAQAVLALAQNPYITGQILQVDGGRSIAK